MTLRQAIHTYLASFSEITDVTTDIFYQRVKSSKTNPPYIVYDIWEAENKLGAFQWQHWYEGRIVTLDVVWPYSMQNELEDLYEVIKAKIGGFQGTITHETYWDFDVSFSIKFADNWYDAKTDFSVYRLGFLAKYTF